MDEMFQMFQNSVVITLKKNISTVEPAPISTTTFSIAFRTDASAVDSCDWLIGSQSTRSDVIGIHPRGKNK